MLNKYYLCTVSKEGKVCGTFMVTIWFWQSPQRVYDSVLKEIANCDGLFVSDIKRVC